MVYEWKYAILLITGGSNGIGSQVVKQALEEGVQRVIILDIDEKAGVTLQDELNTKYESEKVKFVKCDLSDTEQVTNSFESILADKSKTYVVLNGAGILNDSMEGYKKCIQVNVAALITGSMIALDVMRKDKGGKGGTIINISSISPLIRYPYIPVYAATKAAVLQFSNAIGSDSYYSRTDVRVLTMCFGATDTGIMNNIKSTDEVTEKCIYDSLSAFPLQKVESAGRAVIDAYRLGNSGSTWMSNDDKPVKDITEILDKTYAELVTAIGF